MQKLKRAPADAYWADRAHLEHKVQIFQVGFLALIVLFAVSQSLWFALYARIANPVMVHATLDELSTEPTNVELQFMAWEVLRPFLSVDSTNVLDDIHASKRFMTDSCTGAWDRSLAAYEKAHKKPYVQAVADLGVQTQFGDIQGVRMPNIVQGGVTKYVVRIHGMRTVLSKSRGTGEPTPFDYIVVLERAPQGKTNPIGLLATEIRPAPQTAADGTLRDGQSLVPYAAVSSDEPQVAPREKAQ
jgi:hypothetical protein